MKENELAAVRLQLARQVIHWTLAARRLQNLDNYAAQDAWAGLEQYLGMALRQTMEQSVQRLLRQAQVLNTQMDSAQSRDDLIRVRRSLLGFRRQYLRTETMLDFFADAINTRTNEHISALLRACDSMVYRSMHQLLSPLNRIVPPVLTYPEKGLGASVLKAGLRLWDGSTDNPVAVIKIASHNLLRPTSIIHEAGHQVAHMTGWNEELAEIFRRELAGVSPSVASVWAAWSSEIAADAFAFVHTGYASVAALHDILSGGVPFVFRFLPRDPHPISYVRVLLGVEMCRSAFGSGPWDDLERSWLVQHPLVAAKPALRSLLTTSRHLTAQVADLSLNASMRSFGGRSLTAMINPAAVSPAALEQMAQRIGPALFTSQHWLWTESLRLLALSGLRVAIHPEQSGAVLTQQEAWMERLGGAGGPALVTANASR